MRIALRRVTKALLVVLAVLALGLFAAARLVDVDGWRDDVALTLSNRLGLEVRLTGRLSVSFWPSLGLLVRGIEIRPPGRPDDRPIARIDAVDFEPDLLRSYLEERLVLQQARAAGIEVDLVRDASGEGNWRIPDAALPPPRFDGSASMQIALERIVVEKSRVRYETAVSPLAFELDLHRLDVHAPSGVGRVDVRAEGVVQGRPFEIDLRVGSRGEQSGRLLGPDTVLELAAEVVWGPVEIDTQGRLVHPLGDAQAEFALSLHADDLGDLGQLLPIPDKIDLDGIGALDVTSRLVGGSGRVRLEDLVVTVSGPQTGHVEGRGRFGDLTRGREIELALTVDTPNAASITRRLRIPAPEARAGKGTGFLRGGLPDVRFEEIEFEAVHRLGGKIDVGGWVARGDRTWGARLEFDIVSDRLGDVSVIAEEVIASVRRGRAPIRLGRPELPLQQALMAIGPVRAKATVEGKRRSWSIHGISSTAGGGGTDWLRAHGAIASLVPEPSGIEIEIEGGSDDLEALSRRAGNPIVGLERLRLHGRALGAGNRVVLTDMQAIATTPDEITMGVSGDLPVGDSWRDMRALVAVSARDLSVLGRVLDRSFPALGPLELSAQVREEGESLIGEEMVVAIGDSVVTGRMTIDPGPIRPYVDAVLSTERLHLQDLGLAPPPADEAVELPPGEPGWLDRPLPFDELLVLDGRLDLSIDHLVGRREFDSEDIRLQTTIDDGRLRIDDLALRYEGGRMDVALDVDAAVEPPTVALRLSGDEFRIERVVAQRLEERVATGRGQLVADLRARGRTPRALGASVSGDALFYGRDGGLSMRYSRALQIDLGREANRAAERGDLERVECLIVDVSAKRGVLEFETILFDTENKQVLGSGNIDLRDEDIDMLLTPVFKQTLPGSVAAAVRIQGDLDDPAINPAPLITASATAQGLVDRALLPLRRVLPGVGSAVDDLRRSADRALEGSGVALPDAGLWRPGIDVTCEKVLRTERIEALRSAGVASGRPTPG